MIARILHWIDAFRRRDAVGAFVVFTIVTILATALAVMAVNKVAALTSADRYIEDWEVASFTPPAPQDSDVTVVAIDEGTIAAFPYRSPIDRGFVSDLLTKLAAANPRAIGVDLLFDQPTEPAKDAALARTMRDLKVPLVVGYVDSPNVVDPQQLSYLEHYVPARLRGYVNLGTDQTDTARWIFPGQKARDGTYIPSLSRKLAQDVGISSPSVRVPIVWHGRPSLDTPPFAELPASSIKNLPPAVLSIILKGRVILIGSDLTLVDQHRTPFSVVPGANGTMPGVIIQAHSLAQLLDRAPSPYVSPLVNIAIAFLLASAGAGLGMLDWHLLPRALGGLVFLALFWAGGVYLFSLAGIMIELIAPTLAAAGSFWAMDGLAGGDARRQREFIKGAFSRYVSPKLVEQLVRDPARMSLEGERRVMSYIFTDVKDFTTMSEGLDSKELPRILNAYLDGITQIVLKHDGMVDKFIGDAVFAIFNAPVDLPDHAERAVDAALAIDRFCDGFHREQNAAGIAFGITRIGVHTGPAVIGNFGSHARFTYTAQGDSVNTASRLEGLNKHLGTRICVSDAARQLCHKTVFRPIASVVLKGKTQAVEVWEPLHDEQGKDAEYLARYRAAYDKLEQNAPDALAAFEELARERPDDPCVKLHLDRLRDGETGVAISMTEK
jgi:class 3 adenylate cyclase/CHASE2 domain-containing sensor protein